MMVLEATVPSTPPARMTPMESEATTLSLLSPASPQTPMMKLSSALKQTGFGLKRGFEYVSSFWFAVTLITILVFVLTLTAIIYLNYTAIQHPEAGVELVGTSVNHALTIHSSNSDAELRFLTGFDKSEIVGMRVDDQGSLEMFRNSDDVDDLPPIMMVNHAGTVSLREDVESDKVFRAKGLHATSDGVHFPDGSVMTSAAKTAVGMRSEADLNFVAGMNQTVRGASIVMTVGVQERMRIRKDGIFFRSSSGERRDDGSRSKNSAQSETFDQAISLHPDKKEVRVGKLSLKPDGLASLDADRPITLNSSRLVLKDDSTSPMSATISVGRDPRAVAGLPFLIEGQDAILRGGDFSIKGGNADGLKSKGGDVVIDGGGGSEHSGDVVVGGRSTLTQLNSNKTEINAVRYLDVNAGIFNVNAPIIFNSPIAAFSDSAVKSGATLSTHAVVTVTNATIKVGSRGAIDFQSVDGSLLSNSAFAIPESGGTWAIAERCSTCITFGGEGGFTSRHAAFSLMVEKIYVSPVPPVDPDGRLDRIDYSDMTRVTASCAVVKTSSGSSYFPDISSVEVTSEDAIMVASTSFFGGDDFVSLSGTKLGVIEGASEYSVFCRASAISGSGVGANVVVRAEKISLSIIL